MRDFDPMPSCLRPTMLSVAQTSAERLGRWAWASAGVLVLVAVVILISWQPWREREEPASLDRMAFPLPDKPSVAVLPFSNLSGDPDQEYFSDGSTENVITTLSQLPEVFVIARNSTFIYKGRAVKVQTVEEELGVRYVLEGSYQRAVDRVRVHAQFIDALTGHHIWAERFDRTWEDVFSLQDDITHSIVSALSIKLTEKEKARIAKRFTDDVEAYDLFLRGQALFFRSTKGNNERARTFYRRAIERDDDFARAYAALATSHIFDVRFGWSDEPEASSQLAMDYARKAIDLDEELPHAHVMLGQVHVIRKNYEAALAAAKRTIDLDGNFADAYALLATVYAITGRSEEAVPEIERAMRLNLHPPGIYYYILGRPLFFLRRHEEAVNALEIASEMNPAHLLTRVYLAAAYSQLGREEDAEWQQLEVLALDPDFSIEAWIAEEVVAHPPDLAHLTDGLRKAGLPE